MARYRVGFSLVIVGMICLWPILASAQPDHEDEIAKNLKVLPKDMPHEEIDKLMIGYSRALGVRCNHCHVGEPGKMRQEDFHLDDKPEKDKTRQMIQMTRDLNEKYLPMLGSRENPPIRIDCVTCHRGVTEPRLLQDILRTEYDRGGIDSSLVRYQALRDRYYGRASYDFGEAPLADLANQVKTAGNPTAAVRFLEYNVEMNPKSNSAKRQHASGAISMSFQQSGSDSAAAVYHRLQKQYGEKLVGEPTLNDVGYQLLFSGAKETAILAFQLNTAEHPQSGNAFDSLGEGFAIIGKKPEAIEAYTKAVQLDPTNENAMRRLAELTGGK